MYCGQAEEAETARLVPYSVGACEKLAVMAARDWGGLDKCKWAKKLERLSSRGVSRGETASWRSGGSHDRVHTTRSRRSFAEVQTLRAYRVDALGTPPNDMPPASCVHGMAYMPKCPSSLVQQTCKPGIRQCKVPSTAAQGTCQFHGSMDCSTAPHPAGCACTCNVPPMNPRALVFIQNQASTSLQQLAPPDYFTQSPASSRHACRVGRPLLDTG